MVAARGAMSAAAASGAAAALCGRSRLANSSDTTTRMPVARTPRRTRVMRRTKRAFIDFGEQKAHSGMSKKAATEARRATIV